MEATTISTILAIVTPLAAGVVAGLVGLIGVWMNRIQTKEKARIAHAQALDDIKVMQENSKLAVQAAEQLGKDMSGEEKAKLALGFAQTWNKLAGVSTSSSVVTPLNEAQVLMLPPSKKEESPCLNDAGAKG
jgi:hypothetical protein